jgi:L-lactate dehydrogenase complex protein LldG
VVAGADVTGAREEVLGRVRAAVRGAEAVEVPRDYRRSLGLEHGELLDLLAARIDDYSATVRRAEPAAGVAAAMEAHGSRRVAVAPGVPGEWVPPAVEVVDARTPAELDDVDAALTGCAVAIAETGTIVLDGGALSGPRALTLVPDRHVCVVAAEAIVGTLPEAFERLEEAVRGGRPITFVSGPSATSDIELSRVEGVHGPRVLDVVLP